MKAEAPDLYLLYLLSYTTIYKQSYRLFFLLKNTNTFGFLLYIKQLLLKVILFFKFMKLSLPRYQWDTLIHIMATFKGTSLGEMCIEIQYIFLVDADLH